MMFLEEKEAHSSSSFQESVGLRWFIGVNNRVGGVVIRSLDAVSNPLLLNSDARERLWAGLTHQDI